jgi:hypothetical protein
MCRLSLMMWCVYLALKNIPTPGYRHLQGVQGLYLDLALQLWCFILHEEEEGFFYKDLTTHKISRLCIKLCYYLSA